MERTTLLGTETGLRLVERCKECRGHVARAGDEFVCTSCGVVVRKVEEEKFHLEIRIRAPGQLSDGRLGSYIGDRSDKNSREDFNGISTLGFAKLLSDNLGVDGSKLKCRAMIRRVGDRLSLPAFVQQNAMALAEKALAEGSGSGRRIYLAAASAYSILSAVRTAEMDHVSSQSILQAHADLGHRVTRSALLRMGLDSKVPFRAANPAALVRTVLNGLEADEAVLKRLKKFGVEPGPYFRGLFQASQTVLGALRTVGEGRNPRTIAAAAVYLASQGTVTQRKVAEIAQVAEYTVRDFVGRANKEVGALNARPS